MVFVPSIVVNLLANGEKVAQKNSPMRQIGKKSFTGLPKFKDGKEIVYTLQEEKVAEYTTTIDQAAYTITNTHAPGKTSVTVTKSGMMRMTRMEFVRRVFAFNSMPMIKSRSKSRIVS